MVEAYVKRVKEQMEGQDDPAAGISFPTSTVTAPPSSPVEEESANADWPSDSYYAMLKEAVETEKVKEQLVSFTVTKSFQFK